MSYGGFFTEIGKEFLDVATRYDKRRGQTDDVNGLYECNKYGVCLFANLLLILNADEGRFALCSAGRSELRLLSVMDVCG